ncbi:uncharacterized protein LOC128672008 [Plodia interpunctella]|uniref:uncharacterized protein LOC128672008 n=1 Tax=Plodia interpunctella TaxID=58824 RepID=UPI002367682A|nr:uncharacterized protein LOC128672008 [Plodia interpunctella]
MKALWIIVILQSLQLPIFAQASFGTSFLTSSKLCRGWSCLNNKLGLPNSLPSRTQYEVILKSLLPENWHLQLDSVLDTCYQNRTRAYTNTCPGQAMMHCVVDNLIENCPESHHKKEDACTPVSCTAGLSYMFSQSRYEDFEENLPRERRPTWFLKNYFDTKCCDLTPLFSTSVLAECGFAEFMHYYEHVPQNVVSFSSNKKYPTLRQPPLSVHVKHDTPKTATPSSKQENSVKIVDPIVPTTTEAVDIKDLDPLDCCDMSHFIQPSWRSECDFAIRWDNQNRLSLTTTTPAEESPNTNLSERTSSPEDVRNDVRIGPLPCESETCVFNKLNILSLTGDVNLDLFTKLLDNFTRSHPEFTKAKARVITECMKKPLLGYDEECQINKVLACTFDVLSEYCPYTNRKNDPCRKPDSNMMCQISSSHIRPKFRRSFCSLPDFVPERVLSECGIVSLSNMMYVKKRPKKRYTAKPSLGCQPLTEPTSCLLDKMGVINKYKFVDYFKMKDLIRSAKSPWSALTDVYVSAFTNKPMYGNHCNSPRQLLNVIDTMLMTCPVSLRKTTAQCNQFFTETMNTAPYTNTNLTKAKLDRMVNHFQHIFLPVTIYQSNVYPRNKSKISYKPLYNYGVLASGNVPPVSMVDINPKTPKKPLMILPVYMRLHNQGVRYPAIGSTGTSSLYSSPLLRSAPLGQNLAMPAKPKSV